MARFPRVILPLLSLTAASFAFYTVLSAHETPPAPPRIEPPRNPFESAISGNGIVVPPSERNIELAVPFPGLVTKVHVVVGQELDAGAVILQLDDRSLRATVAAREAARELARMKIARLAALPRKEELPPLVARVDELQEAVLDWTAQVARLDAARAKDPGAVMLDDVDRRKFALEAGKRALLRAKAELELQQAGAWGPDLDLARAELAEAEAVLGQAQTELERATVKAPVAGRVLEVNVRAGEYAATGGEALVLFADRGTPRVRVDIDEEQAPLLIERPRAYGTLRGFASERFTLELVRVEPYVKPKRSLTGDNKERVDTRVLQLVFEVSKAPLPIFIGQQMDVFLEGRARGPASRPTSGESRR